MRALGVDQLPFARRLQRGRRVRGVRVHDETLDAPFAEVRLRSYSFSHSRAGARAEPLVVLFPDGDVVSQWGRRSGEWLAGSLARRLPLTVTVVQIPPSVIADREAAYLALLAAVKSAAGAGSAPGAVAAPVAVLGVGTGGALAARTAMRARDDGAPTLQRQALVSPDFNLVVGPPATSDALRTSLIALVSELPATLIQQYGDRGASRRDPSQNLPELLREAGVAVRSIDYPPARRDWTEYPRAVRSSDRALDDLVAFLERGIVIDGFDAVPAWNLH